MNYNGIIEEMVKNGTDNIKEKIVLLNKDKPIFHKEDFEVIEGEPIYFELDEHGRSNGCIAIVLINTQFLVIKKKLTYPNPYGWTKNLENKGSFEFFIIKCKDKNLNNKMISVTGNHTMIIYKAINHKIAFRQASQVKIGDLFITPDGLFEVYEIKREMMNNSYEMRVENGTVLANDILVSTLYLEKNEVSKNQKKIINSFKNEYEYENLN